MKNNLRKYIKQIIAVILIIAMLPLSEFTRTINVSASDEIEKNEVGEVTDVSLDGIVNKQGNIELTWNYENVDESISKYIIYKNDNKYAEINSGTKTYEDTDVQADMKYVYYVKVYNSKDECISKSRSISVGTSPELIITTDYKLENDMEVYALKVNGGKLDLNGHTLTVHKDINFLGGSISYNAGSLYCYGNCSISGQSYMYMNTANDYLYVDKDINICDNGYGRYYMTNGVIETHGDFSANRKSIFMPGGHNKVIFSGNRLQKIDVENVESGFNIIELRNYSAEGVSSDEQLLCNSMIRNNCKLVIAGEDKEYGHILTTDEEVNGDFNLIGDTLDLNGHTLTIKGDLLHSGGTIYVNGGRLVIEGDYIMRHRKIDESTGNFVYDKCTALLKMKKTNDYVLVKGDFITESGADHSDCLTDGVLEIKGDLIQKNTYTNKNFISNGNHKVVLSGEKRQTVTIISGSNYSGFCMIDIKNTSTEGVNFTNDTCVSREVKDNGCNISGYIKINKEDVIGDAHYHGNVILNTNINKAITIDGNVNVTNSIIVSGSLSIGGDLSFTNGTLIMQNGSVVVKGNARFAERFDGFDMNNSNDNIHIYGDFYYKTEYQTYSRNLDNGIIEVGGNFTSDSSFRAEGSHRVVLSGDKLQTVKISNNDYFAILELKNSSKEGVYSDKTLAKSELIRNGCRLKYGDLEGEFGWTLKEDTVIDGDLVLIDDTLDLNGYSLIVKGDLIQPAGLININNGKLIVEKDYRVQTRTGSRDDYNYSMGSGNLRMTKDDDYVLVKGSYYNMSNSADIKNLTNGLLEVQGDFTVSDVYSKQSFYSTQNHRTLLSGSQKQIVTFNSNNIGDCQFASLEITGNDSKTVEINGNPYICKVINDNNCNIDGSIKVGSSTVFVNGHFSGSVMFIQNRDINEDLEIGRDLSSGYRMRINSANLTINGNYTNLQNASVIMNSGYLNIKGNAVFNNEDYNHKAYGIEMLHDEDHVIIGGNFKYSVYYSSYMKAGILELKGNADIGKNMNCSGTHRLVLSGASKQTVIVSAVSYFNDVELQNHSEEGVYSEKVFNRRNLYRNGCRITYKGLEGQYGWKLTKDEVIENDLVILDDTLDLNGCTLTVNGDLVVCAGKVCVNGGKLIVKGDFRLQAAELSNGTALYSVGAGALSMENDSDYVCIYGDYIDDTMLVYDTMLKAGTLEIKGNMVQQEKITSNKVYADGTNTILFSGNSKQSVNFSSIRSYHNMLKNVTFKNTSREGVEINGIPVFRGCIDSGDTVITGCIGVGKSFSFVDSCYNGDVSFAERMVIDKDIEINGNARCKDIITFSSIVTVKGNYTAEDFSNTIIDNGNLTINGNAEFRGDYYKGNRCYGIRMSKKDDYVHIKGDLYYQPYNYDSVYYGTMRVDGNIVKFSNIDTYNTFTLLLGGDRLQTVNADKNVNIAVLEIQNYSNAGVYSPTVLDVIKLVRNNCRLQYGNDECVFGWKLDSDYCADGDFVLIDDTLDLNGHTLTVNGDFIHQGGKVSINGGKLIVSGDYHMQKRSGEKDSYTYSQTRGILAMQSDKDHVQINGNMNICLYADNVIENGTLEVNGDVIQTGTYTLAGGGNSILKLNGTENQKLNAKRLQFGNLYIDNSSSKNIKIETDISIINKIHDNSAHICGTGAVIINRTEQIENGQWSGNIALNGKDVMYSDLNIGGNLLINGVLDLNGHVLYTGSVVIKKEFYINRGSVICIDSFSLDKYAKLIMKDRNDNILVNGDFSAQPYRSDDCVLTDGIIEVRGKYTQNNRFVTSGEHTIVLGRRKKTTERAYIQEFVVNDLKEPVINKLIMKKPLTEYQFSNEIESICRECVYDIEDEVPPSAVKVLEAVNTNVTDVTLHYEGAEDDNRIAGYEIYRNGERIAVTGSNQYTDSCLSPDSDYVYNVYAFDEYRNMATKSPNCKVHTMQDNTAPDTVEGLYTLTRTGSSVKVAWKQSHDNSGKVYYRLYRDGNVIADNIEKLCYKDEGLSSGKLYLYEVEAYDASGNKSEKSNSLEAAVALPQIKKVYPEDGSSIGGTGILLSVDFKNSGNSTGNKVKIEYRLGNGEWQNVSPIMLEQINNGNLLHAEYNWDISGLSGNGTYTVRFTLYDADGNTDSKECAYIIDHEAPKNVSNFKVVSDNGNICLNWEASLSADCSYYNIYRKNSTEGSYKKVKEVKGRYTEDYVDTDVKENMTYYYVITASDEYNNECAFSEAVMTVSGSDSNPPVVKDIMPKAGCINARTELVINAMDNRAVQKVILQYRKEEEESWNELAEIGAVNGEFRYSWDTCNVPDGNYIVNAVAADTSGNRSVLPFTRRYTVDNTGIRKLKITKAIAGTTSVQLHWTDAAESDFAYFQVEQVTDNENVYIGKCESVLGYNVSELRADTKYRFIIVGYDTVGNRGVESDIMEVITASDTSGPVIRSVYPVASYYRDNIVLKAGISDNCDVDKVVFSYSLDKNEYKEIATVKSGTVSKNEELKYNWDISKLEEGNVYVRFEAYDAAGNKNTLLKDGSEIEVEYKIDRTAPEKVVNPVVSGGEGYLGISWDAASEKDIASYKIFRADNEDGIFKVLVRECKSKNYYDTNVESGKSYIYKISAVDIAGNEGKSSDQVIGTVSSDEEAPVIRSITPYDKSTVGANPEIKILAIDNSIIASVRAQYMMKDAKDGIWNTIDEKKLNQRSGLVSIRWDTKGLKDGSYNIRITAVDAAGNESEGFVADYELDSSAPEIPGLSLHTADYGIKLDIAGEQPEDFSHYEIFRCIPSESVYESVADIKNRQYTDNSVEVNVIYRYKLRVYDKAGNYSESKAETCYAADNDSIKPKAVLSENYDGIAGMEMSFDGTQSSDNVRITEYKWNMGNGDILTGPHPVYTYNKSGDYTVILEVSDAAGNKSSTTTTVRIQNRLSGVGVSIIKVTSDDGMPIASASICVKTENEEPRVVRTDCYGYASVCALTGLQEVAVYAEGYTPRSIMIKFSELGENRITVKLQKGDVVIGHLSAKRMDLQEMMDSGVDLNCPENYNVYKFEVTLTLQQNPIPINIVYVGGTDSVYKKYYTKEEDEESTGSGSPKLDTDGPGLLIKSLGSYNEKPILAYISTTQSIRWLKEMYNVELGVFNAADEEFEIRNSNAHINIPEGMSLASTATGQDKIQSMGTIKGQTAKSVSWIVRGDTSGSYQVSADFEGKLMPFEEKINAHFETAGSLNVSTGEGISIYIKPEKSAYIGEKYYIQFELVNESNRTFYNVSTTFGKYIKPTKKTVTKIIDTRTGETKIITNEEPITYVVNDVNDNQLPEIKGGDGVNISTFLPGERLRGTYETEFQAEGDPEEVYYKLVKWVTETLEGANLGVKVQVQPIESHMSKSITKIQDVSYYGDPIDVDSGGFVDEINAMTVYGGSKLSFRPEYNSLSAYNKTSMGYGWTHNFSSRIEFRNGILDYYADDNSRVSFVIDKTISGTLASIESSIGQSDNNQGITYASNDTLTSNYSVYNNRKVVMNCGLLKEIDFKPMNCNMKDYNVVYFDGYFYVKTPKTLLVYDSDGKLIDMSSSNEHVTLTYGDRQMIITDELSEKRIKVNYSENGLVSNVEDDNGRIASFSYKDNMLVSYTSIMGNVTTYKYDNNIRIISEAGNNGVTYVENEYDSKGRVIHQKNGGENGGDISLSYKDTTDGTEIKLINEMGYKTYRYTDMLGRLLKEVNERGGVTTYNYGEYLLTKTEEKDENEDNDKYGEKKTVTDGKGNSVITYSDADENPVKIVSDNQIVLMTYDSSGNVTKITDGYGNEAEVKYKEALNNTSDRKYMDYYKLVNSIKGIEEYTELPIWKKDYAGGETSYKYNENGQLSEETIEGLGTIKYSYTDGLLSDVTDRNGNTTHTEYDKTGNPVSVTNPDGSITRTEYDAEGRITSKTDALGNTATYTYDSNGNPITFTDVRGNTTVSEYNTAGRLISETTADGITSYEYNTAGKVTRKTFPDGTMTSYKYDAAGNVTGENYSSEECISSEYDILNQITSSTDEEGNRTEYEYNAYGNPVKTIYADGESETCTYDMCQRLVKKSDSKGNTTSYEYDKMGRKTKEIDPSGGSKVCKYDIHGRLMSETDQNGNITSYAYDNNGNCIRKTNAAGIPIFMEYDSMNRVIRMYMTGADGKADHEKKYTYDACGHVMTETDEEGNTTYYTYDDAGNVLTVTDACGNVVSVSEYDHAGRVTSALDATGNRTVNTYDAMGCVTSTASASGTLEEAMTTYTYDKLHRCNSATDSMNGTCSITYTGTGLAEKVTDPNGGTTYYEYDCMGRTKRETNAVGCITDYTYNAIGLLEEKKNARNQNTVYKYDASGRITSFTDEEGTVSYTYDACGNVLTVSDGKGTITRTYDELNRVNTCTDYRGNVVRYSYDEIGNLISLTYPGGEIVRYTYYKNGRMKSVTDWKGNITSYAYNGAGKLTETDRPDGSVETCTYDAAGKLLEQKDCSGDTVINDYHYSYDHAGNITGISGTRTTSDGRTIKELEPSSMEYDKSNRLISFNGEKVKYNECGNMTYGPLEGRMQTFTYDCRNRLISAGGTTYTYDAENTRLSKSTTDYTEEYITETVSSKLSRVLMSKKYMKDTDNKDELPEEASQQGNSEQQTSYYVYGNGLISQLSDRGCILFHYNNNGSTTALTDSTGCVIQRYTYGAYGELLTGDSSFTSYLYNGKYGVEIGADGLCYMRTR